MPLLIVLLTLILPRTAIVLLWLFTDWFNGIFSMWIVPLLAFIFMPYTLLWYSAAHHWFGGLNGFWPGVIMLLAVLMDLSQLFSAGAFNDEE